MKKSPLNHCDSEMMHSGGWGQVRKYNSPGTTGNKEAITHNKKIMSKIGTFNMPNSPLNKGHEVNQDSIASAKAWKAHKAEYLKKPDGLAEYNREKGEFFYDVPSKKLKLIPTDDGEVQDRSGIEKWQLAPDRKSSALHQNDMLGNRFEREQDEPGETQFFNKRKTIKPLSTGGGGDEYYVPEPRGTYKDIDGTVKFEDGTDAGYPEERVYNMTPNATPEESRAVRDKFDATYMKGRGPFLKSRCWEGYEPTPGVKAYEPGSCRKIGSDSPAKHRMRRKHFHAKPGETTTEFRNRISGPGRPDANWRKKNKK